MIPNVNDFSWQSLYEYIERIIANISSALDGFSRTDIDVDVNEDTLSLRQQLDHLLWLKPLVREMSSRQDMQLICPIMSVGIIRLRCHNQDAKSTRATDLAWLWSVSEKKFGLKRIKVIPGQDPETLWSIEGNLEQIVEEIEKLVREHCSQKD